jgi:hypothetical protein
LTPEAAGLIETYFARLHGALLVNAADECEEAVEDLRAHVLEQLEGIAGTAADVTRVLAALGSPETLAAQCAAEAGDSEPAPPASERGSRFSGTFLGMPYDLRPPTGERVVSRWWDPLDPHVIVPRLFGMGWTINFGAVAVKLGLVAPDDEDVPFGEVPERYLAIALVLPLLVAAVLGALVAVYQAGLPAQVAVHYGITGSADRFDSKESALIVPVGMTVVMTVLVIAAWLRRRPPLLRVGTGALATMLGTVSVAVYAQEVATAYGASGAGILLLGLGISLVLTFGLLVTLSRIGHAAEVRRDLGDATRKGSVR